MINSSFQIFFSLNFSNSKAAASNSRLNKNRKSKLSDNFPRRVRNIFSDIDILCHLHSCIIQKSFARMFIKCDGGNKCGTGSERNMHHLQISLKQTIFPRFAMYHYKRLVKPYQAMSAQNGKICFVNLLAASLQISIAAAHHQININFFIIGRKNKKPVSPSQKDHVSLELLLINEFCHINSALYGNFAFGRITSANKRNMLFAIHNCSSY